MCLYTIGRNMGFITKAVNDVEDPLTESQAIAESIESRGNNVIKLNMGDPAKYFRTPQNIIDAYTNALQEGKTSYLPGQGLMELRAVVAERYSDLYRLRFGADAVTITQGAVEALDFLNRSVISKNDSAILLAPFFTQYLPYILLQEGVPLMANYDEKRGWDINFEALERTVKKGKKPKYLLLGNPNNPTGTTLAEGSLRRLVEFANNNDLFIVSDEIYDEIIQRDRFISIGQVASGVPYMILNGASKNYFATGFRIGFSIIPGDDKKSAELRHAFVKLAFSRLSTNVPAQHAILEGMAAKKEHAAFMQTVLPKIHGRRSLAAKLVNESGFLNAVMPDSAFYVFAKIDFEKLNLKDDREFVGLLLKEQHVQLTRGSSFGMEGYVRFVTLPEESQIEEAIARVKKFCKNHEK